MTWTGGARPYFPASSAVWDQLLFMGGEAAAGCAAADAVQGCRQNTHRDFTAITFHGSYFGITPCSLCLFLIES